MQESKTVIISVTSDLVTDQRVHRTASTLQEGGYKVILVGRKRKNSLSLDSRIYQTKRFNLWFETGLLFYATFNLRLFVFLLFTKADYLFSNDLDTLAPNFLISKIKKAKLIYDSHEYFTEVPELTSRSFVRSVWLFIEESIFPRLKNVITVNDSIARIYKDKYHVSLKVIRNLPYKPDHSLLAADRKEWGIPSDKKVFLFQGAGINIDRGAEEAVEAIRFVKDAVLLFIGGGDVVNKLMSLSTGLKLEDKVFFIPKQPMDQLIRFTKMADYGLTLDRDTNLNYRFSLPNKLFDYIHAGLPVLSTDLPELSKIIIKYDIGLITPSADPVILAEKMKEMMAGNIALWKKNLNIAASDLCWEKERIKLLEIIKDETS